MAIIDCDVHQTFKRKSDIVERLPAFFRERGWNLGIGLGGIYSPVGVLRRDARPPDGGPPGSDLATMREQLLDRYDIDYAILNGGDILGCGVLFDVDYACALATAYNDWMIEEWLSADDRLLGSAVVAPQDPQKAAAEIRRVGPHPKIVQVIMASGARIPFGQRFYHPIYEAAEELGLPVAIHPGTEGKGIANVPTAAGYPSTYLEWHTNLSQNFMGHLVSLVCEGVFEKFPGLRFVLIEGGFGWLPHLMWRLDKNYKGLRSLVPWLRALPSEYIRRHVRLTTQPIEEPPRAEHLLAILEIMHGGEILMFSSDYPHWDFDDPVRALARLPQDLRRRILYENAAELYGLKAAGTPGRPKPDPDKEPNR